MPATDQSFNQENAATFDQKREKLEPIKDALHLLMQAIFSKLPAQARLLCVGAGTGAELINLAMTFPQWHFTVVEPAPAMISLCRQKAEQHHISSRCTFHEGYLDSLGETRKFDAATAILVSHFIADFNQRIAFFRAIAERLCPGAYLVNADLCADRSQSDFSSLLEIWATMHKRADIDFHETAFIDRVTLSSKREIQAILADAGFIEPIHFYQSLFIHAWLSKTPKI